MNQSKNITEIHFYESFDAVLENGVKIGTQLDNVLNMSSDVNKTVQTNFSDAYNFSKGVEKVLYEIINSTGNITKYMFVDGNLGILYWFEKNKYLTQIVVFKSY